MFYFSALAGMRPVIEYCGGTEIGGGYISSTVLQANVPSTFSTAAVGLDFLILDDLSQPATEGEIFLLPPSLGLSTRLLNRNHRETYFGGTPQIPCGLESASGNEIKQSLTGQDASDLLVLRRHGDHFRRLPGYTFVAGGRVDDTMHLGGIKVSSAELERVMNEVEGIHETAAIAMATSGGPEQLVVFAVCQRPLEPHHLLTEFNQRLKTELNPLFRVQEVRVVASLPRTASNKIMRRKLRDVLVSG
jgi:acetyl-CoA synthetase